MSVILRLQGLDEKAGSDDIRSFFEPLHIPDGGVYIVGGSLREAFIAFRTEREAQLAMRQSGRPIKGSKVLLHISSMAQLEHRLESLIKAKASRLAAPQPQSAATFPSSPREDNDAANLLPSAEFSSEPDAENLPRLDDQEPSANTSDVSASNEHPLDSNTAFLFGICTVLQHLQSTQTTLPGVDFHTDERTGVPSEETETPEQTLNSRPGYVRLFGLPASTTKEDICNFFKGLTVQEAIVNVRLGPSRGCVVKFAKIRDAFDALRFNKQLLGSVCVEVRGADEKMWLGALEECENASDVWVTQKPERRLKDNLNKRGSVLQLKRKTAKQFPLKPSKRQKLDAPSTTSPSQSKEYIVVVSNLLCTMTKTEIKELFGCPNISHKNVLHLLDKNGSRTDKAFLIFNRAEDFDYAINLSGCHVGSDTIQVSSITRKDMSQMLLKNHPKYQRSARADPRLCRRRESDSAELEALPSKNLGQALQTCLFVRNMPADVQRSQIKNLFCQFKLKTDDIILLRDRNGDGTGEAVIKFQSEKLAAQAQTIHGKTFLGTNVLLTRISMKQMEDILASV
ncbi:RNA binding motif protein 12Ba [Kryptolebias marmoratus]|uniref:RNA binding motif protein 12Ba n=1 Tax=Kryptolebias marmoratus TaxID=37003 RepID=UPI0007F92581|nr:RNA binding motif protein 12Ba [Kryptolebias marmoratus]